jgi:adenylate cyclase
VISSLLPTGERYTPPQIQKESLQKILEAPLGIFNWQGKSYYFVHLQPYPSIDLHFFLFNQAEVEFSLMKKLNEKIQHIIAQINQDRRYVIVLGLVLLLLALLRLSKKITKPIISMAEAAKAVKKGTLYEISLPEVKLGSQNEVQHLNEAFRDMIEGLKEKEKVKGILDKVVSHDIAREILKGEIHLGGEEREVTIFFADIRNFTSLTQKMSPGEVIELINTCMTKLSHIIDEHHGVIDKYIGDEVMVLFGAPLYSEDSALKAINCALEIMQGLKRWNVERERSNLPAVTMGIGIHTGKVCAGNMGAENRLNYTVIGSNVNLASRLCATAKQGEILISENTLSAPFVKERIEAEDLGMIPLKGFDESKHVYRVKGKK